MSGRWPWRIVSAAILAALPLSFGSSWSPGEKRCAAAIGVDLGGITRPSDFGYFRHLTWLADVVVLGRVDRIEYDLAGGYPTLVRVTVASVEKGRTLVSPRDTVHVNLLSGRTYNPRTGTIEYWYVSHELSFLEGENVLLFLGRQPFFSPGEPAGRYDLQPGHYTSVAGTKWLVDGEEAWSPKSPSTRFQVESLRRDIAFTNEIQAHCPKQ